METDRDCGPDGADGACALFFFISQRESPLPVWARHGLNCAPIAALAAVIAPDLLMSAGHLSPVWPDARFWGAVCAAAYCLWRRRDALGLAVYLTLELELGW